MGFNWVFKARKLNQNKRTQPTAQTLKHLVEDLEVFFQNESEINYLKHKDQMSMEPSTIAVYYETYKNMNPSNPCIRGGSSVPAENCVIVEEEEEEENTNGENNGWGCSMCGSLVVELHERMEAVCVCVCVCVCVWSRLRKVVSCGKVYCYLESALANRFFYWEHRTVCVRVPVLSVFILV
jgi:hypothetical protein